MNILMILEFAMIGVSRVDSETFVCGCSFGGCVIFFRKSFSTLVSVSQVLPEDFVLYACQTLLLVSVYLPFDNRLFGGPS